MKFTTLYILNYLKRINSKEPHHYLILHGFINTHWRNVNTKTVLILLNSGYISITVTIRLSSNLKIKNLL